MNITFLIGNGFDLNLGLKTSYQDFYKYYLKQKNNDIDIRYLKKDIFDNSDNWSDAELELGKYTKNFYGNVQQFENCYNDFLSELSKYLEEEQNKVKINSSEKSISIQMDKIVGDFYTTNFLTNQSFDIIKKIISSKSNENWRFNFINFNYTNTLEQIIKTSNKTSNLIHRGSNGSNYSNFIKEPIYIHGKLNDGMVLGVDNPNQISNDAFKNDDMFKNYFIKSNAISEYGTMTTSLSKQTIESSKIICVFGMSFGDTDRTWWNTIKNWLNKEKDNQLILYIYEPDINPSSISNFNRVKYNIYKHLFQSDILKDQDTFKNRVHFSFNKDLFGGLRKCITIDKTESENNTKELITL